MVPHHSAQSAAVGSPCVAGAEQDDLGARLGGRVRPELDHELVHADPAADRRRARRTSRPRPGCSRAGGCRRRSRAAPARPWSPRSAVQVRPYDTPAPAAIGLTLTSWERSVITGRRRDPGRGGDARRRVDPVRGDADPDQVQPGLRHHQRAGRVGQVPQRRLQSGRPGDLVRRAGRRRAGSAPRGGRARRRRRGATRCRPPPAPRRPRPPPRPRTARASRPPAAPLRDSPVSTLRCTRARRSASPPPRPAGRSGRRDWAETSTCAATSGRQVLLDPVQPGQQRPGVAGLAQGQRLGRGGHAQPAGARPPGPRGRRRSCRGRSRRP